MDIKDFYLKEQVYDLDDLIKNPNAYIGGFNTESLVTLMKANRKKYIESGILLIEGGIAFTSSYKEIGQLPIFDDLPSLWLLLKCDGRILGRRNCCFLLS